MSLGITRTVIHELLTENNALNHDSKMHTAWCPRIPEEGVVWTVVLFHLSVQHTTLTTRLYLQRK